MTDVLISAGDLAAFKEPRVIIDTRNPDAYGAGHIPSAVNVHEIFTYLATSTPEGIHELKTKFADAFGKAGLSGKETAVIYEQSMNSGFVRDRRRRRRYPDRREDHARGGRQVRHRIARCPRCR